MYGARPVLNGSETVHTPYLFSLVLTGTCSRCEYTAVEKLGVS